VRRDFPAVTPPVSTVGEVVTWTQAENLFTNINITIFQAIKATVKIFILKFSQLLSVLKIFLSGIH
jgi:hypothetical protein